MYVGMKEEYSDDEDLLLYLEDAKKNLHEYYQTHYVCQPTALASQASSTSKLPPTKFSFTARYENKSRKVLDELEDYFRLTTPEPFNECRPLQWWLGRRAQYPNLYRLAHDILAIPG